MFSRVYEEYKLRKQLWFVKEKLRVKVKDLSTVQQIFIF